MMAARDEEAQVLRALTLATTRRLCSAWGYWCFYGRLGEIGGRPPIINTGGIEKQYKTPPQWHPPEPRMPEADENVGLAVQRGYIRLPLVFRGVLRAEFCVRPWVIPLRDGDLETLIARKARVSVGAYELTLERALLALANVMKRHGLWRE